jgi:hypothetical protein
MAATSKTIIINGVPAAWATPIKDPGDGTGLILLPQLKFDNITTPVIGFPFAGDAAAAGGGDNIDIVRGDGAIIRFPKDSLTIDGRDETVIAASGGSSADTAAIGTINFSALQADIDSTNYPAFIKKLKDNRLNYWLVCVPLGENYERRHNSSATDPNAVGYAFLFAKLTGSFNLSVAPQTGAPVALSFTGTKYSGSETNGEALLQSALFPPIAIKCVTPAYTPAPQPQPSPITTPTEAADLLKGDILIK